MDTFITVISWLAGFYALFILALTIGFSAGGHPLWILYIFMFLPVPLIVVVFYKKLKES